MKRFIFGAAIVLAVIAAIVLGLLFGVGWFLSPQDKLVKADVIVAISGGETQAREQEAAKLYKEGWAPTIIFSGAASDPNSPSNALVMKRLAVTQGVPASAIVLDEDSTDTAQNASDVAFIIKQHDFHSLILVTSPYHQRRASLTFRDALGKGYVIINHSTIDQSWRRNHWWASPYSRALTSAELKKTLYTFMTNQAGAD